MSLLSDPSIRGILRLGAAVLVVGGIVTVLEGTLTAHLVALLDTYTSWIDGTFRSIYFGIVTENGEAVIRRIATPAVAHVVGGHVVFTDARTRLTSSAAEGVIFQPAIFAVALVYAWPWREFRELGLRVLIALPLVLLVVLLDVPLILYGSMWYQEVSLLDPDRFSPLIIWSDFMNAGGRFALTVAAAAIAVAGAHRLCTTTLLPDPDGASNRIPRVPAPGQGPG
jgi:hypothetical protein